MHTVMPRPDHVTERDGSLELGRGARVVCAPELDELARQFADALAADHGIVLGVSETEPRTGVIRLTLRADAELDVLPRTVGVSPSGREPHLERYRLDVSSTGAEVVASDPEGIHRGLTTLRQLVDPRTRTVPAVSIVDGPRYAWRGLSLDVGRTFLPVAEVERIIDMLDMYKLNVLHLHLTEDAGWRIEIPGRPALTEIGAHGAMLDRPGGYYTVEDYVHLVEYARRRFITVVPEIDVPGHSSAILRSYPELAPGGATSGTPSPLGLPTASLDLAVPGTAELLADVLTELARTTPGPFLHIGGDEAFGVDRDAFTRFVSYVRDQVHGLGKRVVGWQEIARTPIGPSDVVQYWFDRTADVAEGGLGPLPDGVELPPEMVAAIIEQFAEAGEDAARAAEHGASVLLSPASFAYLDVPYAEPSLDADEEERRSRVGLAFHPAKTVREFREWEPESLLARIAPDAKVAGVEAALWSETVADASDAHFLLLPRLPGIAETAWSPAGAAAWDDYGHRLAAQARAWDRRHWGYFHSSLVAWGQAPATTPSA